jgi:hypothetical protein
MGIKHDGEAIKAYIKQNPEMTAAEFLKKSKWPKTPKSVFRYYRDQARKEVKSMPPRRPYRRSPQKIYTTIWSKSIQDLGKEGTRAIKQLVEELSQDKVLNWEVVEIADPAVLEIRETTK